MNFCAKKKNNLISTCEGTALSVKTEGVKFLLSNEERNRKVACGKEQVPIHII